NFDTSSVSRGLCDRTAGPNGKNDYEKTDCLYDSGDNGDAPNVPGLRLPAPYLQRPERRALLAQLAGRNYKHLVTNRRVGHQRSSSSRAARLHERFHSGARHGDRGGGASGDPWGKVRGTRPESLQTRNTEHGARINIDSLRFGTLSLGKP